MSGLPVSGVPNAHRLCGRTIDHVDVHQSLQRSDHREGQRRSGVAPHFGRQAHSYGDLSRGWLGFRDGDGKSKAFALAWRDDVLDDNLASHGLRSRIHSLNDCFRHAQGRTQVGIHGLVNPKFTDMKIDCGDIVNRHRHVDQPQFLAVRRPRNLRALRLFRTLVSAIRVVSACSADDQRENRNDDRSSLKLRLHRSFVSIGSVRTSDVARPAGRRSLGRPGVAFPRSAA